MPDKTSFTPQYYSTTSQEEFEQVKSLPPNWGNPPKPETRFQFVMKCVGYMLVLLIFFPVGLYLMVKDPAYKWKHFFLTIWWGYLAPCIVIGLIIATMQFVFPGTFPSKTQGFTPNTARPTTPIPALSGEVVVYPNSYKINIPASFTSFLDTKDNTVKITGSTAYEINANTDAIKTFYSSELLKTGWVDVTIEGMTKETLDKYQSVGGFASIFVFKNKYLTLMCIPKNVASSLGFELTGWGDNILVQVNTQV